MLIVISPAKTIDITQTNASFPTSESGFPKEAASLVKKLKKYSISELQNLLKVSPKLAELNADRYQKWALPFEGEEAKQALLVLKGEVFQGIDAATFSQEEMKFAQDHLRVLSGLYGVLRPLDVILPYRLEMGTQWTFGRYKNLYHFWENKIGKRIQQDLVAQGDDVLINLASNEYFKSIKQKDIKARIITPEFKDYKDGKYQVVSFFAKKARGLMVRYIVQHGLQNPEELKLFDAEGYTYNDVLSKGDQWVFTR